MRQRRTFKALLGNNKNSTINLSRYFRLMALAGTDIAVSVPLSVYMLHSNVQAGLEPWISWNYVHWHFSQVRSHFSFPLPQHISNQIDYNRSATYRNSCLWKLVSGQQSRSPVGHRPSSPSSSLHSSASQAKPSPHTNDSLCELSLSYEARMRSSVVSHYRALLGAARGNPDSPNLLHPSRLSKALEQPSDAILTSSLRLPSVALRNQRSGSLLPHSLFLHVHSRWPRPLPSLDETRSPISPRHPRSTRKSTLPNQSRPLHQPYSTSEGSLTLSPSHQHLISPRRLLQPEPSLSSQRVRRLSESFPDTFLRHRHFPSLFLIQCARRETR